MSDSYAEASGLDVVFVRITGLGTAALCAGLRDFFLDALEKGRRHFVLDLERCGGVDSTFMGTIAEVVKTLEGDGEVTIARVGDYNRALLAEVGLDRFVTFDDAALPEETAFTRLRPGAGDLDRRVELLYNAHKSLIEIDERNAEAFGRVVKETEPAAGGAGQTEEE